MLHRLRKGMVNKNQSHLSDLAKAEETIIGGSAKHKRGRGVTAAKPKDFGHWCSGGPPLSTPWSSLDPLWIAIPMVLRGGLPPTLLVLLKARKWSISSHRLTIRSAHAARGSKGTAFDSGSTLRTDGWRGQLDVALCGYANVKKETSS